MSVLKQFGRVSYLGFEGTIDECLTKSRNARPFMGQTLDRSARPRRYLQRVHSEMDAFGDRSDFPSAS